MKASELLSLATARSLSLERQPGGIPILTQQDVMYALACIHHNGAALLLRVKYADQTTYLSDLEREVIKATQDLWKDKKWRLPIKRKKEGFLVELSQMAIAEHISSRICNRCGGWGSDVENGKITPCKPCHGSGRTQYTYEHRAETIGMPDVTWRTYWEDKYRYIQDFLIEWEGLGVGRATAKLRGKY